MSARDGNSGIGCLPGLLIILALFMFMAVAGLGSGRVSNDCEGVATCIEDANQVPSEIPPDGVVVDGTLYCPASTEANKAMDGCVPLKEEK